MTPATKRLQEALMAKTYEDENPKTVKKQSIKQKMCKRGPERDTETAQIIAQMWQAGKTGREIGVSLGMTLSAVYMAIQRLRTRGTVVAHRRPGFTAWGNRGNADGNM